MKSVTFIFLFFCSILTYGQELSGSELLQKAIEYHDPNGNWPQFQGTFTVKMQTPNDSERVTSIKLDLPNEIFSAKAKKDSTITNYIIKRGKCIITMADSLRISELKEKPSRTHCETTELYKNYYTYLYGLPMKLKDPGTNIDPKVERKKFKGKDYLVLKAFYDEGVGSDVWYFYFDPETYAMKVYQFFKGDPKAKGKNTGEYILLDKVEIVEGIKMPKTRAWYYNKDDKYLGTDVLFR